MRPRWRGRIGGSAHDDGDDDAVEGAERVLARMNAGVVSVGVGQCGVQVLDAALDALGSNATQRSPFFRDGDNEPGNENNDAGRRVGQPSTTARAVLVDMEAKVVAGTQARRARRASKGSANGRAGDARGKVGEAWRYDRASSVVRDGGGCGNNWSYGHAKLGPSNEDGILEAVRNEVERCDMLGGFFLTQSAAGGTGSGVGSYVTSLLRDHFPSSSVLNYCVLPYTGGEVSVQAYNTVLTLAATLPDTDGSILVPNQHLMDVCTKSVRIASPTVWDVNAVAATEIAAAFLPVRGGSLGGDKGGLAVSSTRLLHGICGHLCAYPRMKLLSLRVAPHMPNSSVDFTTYSWNSVMRSLESSMRMGCAFPGSLAASTRTRQSVEASVPAMPASSASLLVLRGRESSIAAARVLERATASHDDGESAMRSIADPRHYLPWTVSPLMVEHAPTRLGSHEMSAALLSNCALPVPHIRDALSCTYRMLSAGAYVHLYRQHGMEKDEWTHAIATVEESLDAYCTHHPLCEQPV